MRKNITLTASELEIFHKIVKSAFWGRRKTIIKALVDSPHLQYDKKFLQKNLNKANIDEMVRGETLDISAYEKLARIIGSNIG